MHILIDSFLQIDSYFTEHLLCLTFQSHVIYLSFSPGHLVILRNIDMPYLCFRAKTNRIKIKLI